MGLETRPSVWKQGVHQIERYLATTHKNRSLDERPAVYGIVAIGRYMRVYKYDDKTRRVKDWAPPLLEPGKDRHLLDHASEIQVILDTIRREH